MAGKSLKYWRKQWDNRFKKAGKLSHNQHNHDEAWTALELLADYAHFYKKKPFGSPRAWGGSIGRFFNGQWNTKHGSTVQKAIENYYLRDGYRALSPEYHHTDVILASIKESIEKANEIISKKGDLRRILEVIKEKTGVDYFDRQITNPDTLANAHHGGAPNLFKKA